MDPRVRSLYKKLLWIGRDYPLGYEYFKPKLKRAFLKQSQLNTEQELQKALSRGEYVYKEIETLLYLKKYRTLKKAYSEADQQADVRKWSQSLEDKMNS